jgi:hypothetical protein
MFRKRCSILNKNTFTCLTLFTFTHFHCYPEDGGSWSEDHDLRPEHFFITKLRYQQMHYIYDNKNTITSLLHLSKKYNSDVIALSS